MRWISAPTPPSSSERLVQSIEPAIGLVDAYPVREDSIKGEIRKYPVGHKEEVKFQLKTVAGEVANWDRYRWKIVHALDQHNKVVREAQLMANKPCDKWVRVIAKRKYLLKRIDRLESSMKAIQAIAESTQQWLDKVERNVDDTGSALEQLYTSDITGLAQLVNVHGDCAAEHCMYGEKSWKDKRLVVGACLQTFFDYVGNDIAAVGNEKVDAPYESAGEGIGAELS